MTSTATTALSLRPAAKRGSAWIAVILMAILWTLWNRYGKPPWPTYVWALATSGNRFALAIDYPDEWKPADKSNITNGNTAYMVFKRRPPSGLWRWWREHILHENRQEWAMEQVSFTMMPAEKMGITNVTSLFMYLEITGHQVQSDGGPRSRFDYPLGPALDEIRVIPPHSGQTSGIEAPYSLTTRKLTLFPYRIPGGHPVAITAECVLPSDVYRRDRASLERMFQSIRLKGQQ